MVQNDLCINMGRLGQALRQARKTVGCSFRILAGASGVAPSQIMRVESGEYDCTLGTLAKLCGALGMRLGTLLEGCLEIVPEQYAQTAKTEKAIGELAPFRDDSGKTEAQGFLRLVVESCIWVALLLRSGNPGLLVETFTCLLDDQKTRLRRCAERFAQENPVLYDRFTMISDLQTAPIKTLASLGVLDAGMVRKYLALPAEIRRRSGREPIAEFLVFREDGGPRAF